MRRPGSLGAQTEGCLPRDGRKGGGNVGYLKETEIPLDTLRTSDLPPFSSDSRAMPPVRAAPSIT